MLKEPANPIYSDTLGHIFCQRRGDHQVYWIRVNGHISYMSYEHTLFAIEQRGLVLEVLEPMLSVVTIGDMLPMGGMECFKRT